MPPLATLNAHTVHEQFKNNMAADMPFCPSSPVREQFKNNMAADMPFCPSSPVRLPALPASPFAESQLQPQQQGSQLSPPASPTPAVAQLMRHLTLSDMGHPVSPTSSGSSAAAVAAVLGITPACAEALAPVSCSSQLASAPSSAACPANGLGPAPGGADRLQLRAMQLHAQLREQVQQAQQALHREQAQQAQQSYALLGQALPPVTSAPPCYPAAEGSCGGGTFPQGGALAAGACAGWGQRFQQHVQLMPAPLLQLQGKPVPSAVFQAAGLGGPIGSAQLPAACSDVPGAGCGSLPLFQGPEAWAVPQLPLASQARSHLAQQAQQVALHTATQALLMHQLPPHLQLQALLQQHQQLQLQSATASLWQERRAHDLRHAQRGQASQPRQVPGLPACQLAKQAEHDPPESLLGIGGRYQPYCQQVITPRLNEAATCALAAVKLLQAGDAPVAHLVAGKRFFCSLKEVAKVVPTAKCLIVAPDVRTSPTAHINPVAALQRILRAAEASNVPIVFALSRRGIGQVFGRDKSMSIVAIMHLEGLGGHFDVMVEEAIRSTLQGRQLFQQYRGGAAPAAPLHGAAYPAIAAHHAAHHAAARAPAGACCGPPGAGPYSTTATALLLQGLPDLQHFVPPLLA